MTNLRRLFAAAALLAILMLPATALFAHLEKRPISPPSAKPLWASPPGQSAAASSLPAQVHINPEDLAKILQSSAGRKTHFDSRGVSCPLHARAYSGLRIHWPRFPAGGAR